ncbi:hypothetical protein O3P69_020358 [Scylla paramamosain]|uniref:Uncharacterized protein n=1 Tax=Scylla paramamosain TaxID=85552 RepID=A0AAW0TM45_SCYPA
MVHSVTRQLPGIALRHIDRGDVRLMVQCNGRLDSVSPPACRGEAGSGLRVRHRLSDTVACANHWSDGKELLIITFVGAEKQTSGAPCSVHVHVCVERQREERAKRWSGSQSMGTQACVVSAPCAYEMHDVTSTFASVSRGGTGATYRNKEAGGRRTSDIIGRVTAAARSKLRTERTPGRYLDGGPAPENLQRPSKKSGIRSRGVGMGGCKVRSVGDAGAEWKAIKLHDARDGILDSLLTHAHPREPNLVCLQDTCFRMTPLRGEASQHATQTAAIFRVRRPTHLPDSLTERQRFLPAAALLAALPSRDRKPELLRAATRHTALPRLATPARPRLVSLKWRGN